MKTVRGSLAVIVILFSSACQRPEQPKIVDISEASSFKPSSSSEIKTPEQAMAAIITILNDELRIPAVHPIQLYLYKDSAAFAFYSRGWTTLPIDIANVTATTEKDKIHINLDKIKGIPWGHLVWLLSHEYAHAIHNNLAQSHPSGMKWFTEGFAEWVAAKVFHSLGWQKYASTQHRAMKELLHERESLPELSLLLNNRIWENLLSKPKGEVRTYSMAFMAVDRIIQQEGLPATMRYLESGNFNSSFKVSWHDFLTDFGKFLLEMKPSKQTEFSIDKPNWKIGFQWVYLEKRPGKTLTLVKEVIGEQNFRGAPSYLVSFQNETHFYSKETLGLVAIMKKGELISAMDNTDQLLSWPLHSKKQWRNSFTQKDLTSNSIRKFDRLMFTAETQEIDVPAGKLDTINIEAYGFNSGHLLAEYWYSPKVKWFVKVRSYSRGEGLIEDELLSFKIQ